MGDLRGSGTLTETTEARHELQPDMSYSPLDDFVEWSSNHHRACMCGSFNVRCCRAAPNGIEAERYVCDDCGADWLEDR